MQEFPMRNPASCAQIIRAALAVVLFVVPALAQGQPVSSVRRLSIEEAVRLAVEQNLGVQIERANPGIQDVAVAQARSAWVPNVSTSLTNNSANSPATSALSGGQDKITDSRVSTGLALTQRLSTGASYAVAWDSSRATSTNIFNSFDPLLLSTITFSASQPLLRNFRIDSTRQQIETTRKDREAADLQLQSTIALTRRNVRNAYWELAYQIATLSAQRQSLDLARRLLADNEKRVQIGTMAPIDIVEAQAEVARNEEGVIVAEAAIKRAEDDLRALIYDPSAPDFWSITIEPVDTPPFPGQTPDVDDVVRRALDRRLDIQLARNLLARTDIDIQYHQNQTLPEVNAEIAYSTAAAGGRELDRLTSIPLGPIQRSVIAQRGFGSVLGDLLTNTFPTWTLGVTVSYPLGTSTAEANLARSRLERAQSQTRLKQLELQVATQVRDLARQVQTNQKRIESARAARELAERRLDAEERKFAAGIQTAFFVFQAQRDLAQARTTEVRAVSDYAKSLVDLEAAQETELR
jgi:outer membrane protein TolC